MPIFAGDADTTELAERFARWLRKKPGYEHATVEGLGQASAGTGWSNETYRLTIARPRAAPEHLVLRLPPIGEALLKDYDVALQYSTMKALADVPDYPVIGGRWLEPDPAPLGRPFYLMEFAEGDTPNDKPLYHRSGWVADATNEQRRRMWLSTVETIARLAPVNWRDRGLHAYAWPDRSRSCIAQNLEKWERIYDWGATFLPPRDVPIVVELRKWLQKNLPQEETIAFNWGDARFANIIYQDFRPVALLDWELAMVGDPVMDITFFLFAHRHLQLIAYDGDMQAPNLGGFLSEEETLEHYERFRGVKLRNANFYWLFNAYRIYGVRQRIAGLSVKWKTLELEAAMRLRAVPTLEAEIARRMV